MKSEKQRTVSRRPSTDDNSPAMPACHFSHIRQTTRPKNDTDVWRSRLLHFFPRCCRKLKSRKINRTQWPIGFVIIEIGRGAPQKIPLISNIALPDIEWSLTVLSANRNRIYRQSAFPFPFVIFELTFSSAIVLLAALLLLLLLGLPSSTSRDTPSDTHTTNKEANNPAQSINNICPVFSIRHTIEVCACVCARTSANRMGVNDRLSYSAHL